MNFILTKPCGFSQIGGRANNEDFIFPLPEDITENEKIILVCDGVGGANKGEIASEMTAKSIYDFLNKDLSLVVSKKIINEAVRDAQEKIADYITQQPDGEGMATTLTLFFAHENGISLAHAGDSRIYHIRNSTILYRSKDHSYLNELVEQGIITEDEAKNSHNNRITRAVMSIQKREIEADVHLATPEVGDYFFLCTDGVLENLDEDKLLLILQEEISNEEKIEKIKALGLQNPQKDNFSAYLIQVKTVETNVAVLISDENLTESITQTDEPLATTNVSPKENTQESTSESVKASQKTTSNENEHNTIKNKQNEKTPSPKNDKVARNILVMVIFFAVLVLVYLLLNNHSQTNDDSKPEKKENDVNSKALPQNQGVKTKIDSASKPSLGKSVDKKTNDSTKK